MIQTEMLYIIMAHSRHNTKIKTYHIGITFSNDHGYVPFVVITNRFFPRS
jgi:hypothetical protein